MTTLLKTKKMLIFLLIIAISCSKDAKVIELGDLVGDVRLSSNYGVYNTAIAETKIEIIDANGKSSTTYPNSLGYYRIDDVAKGEIKLTIDKQGYGGVNAVNFNHLKDADTLTRLQLYQELDFAYKNFKIDYDKGSLTWSHSTTIIPANNFGVYDLFCFSKSPEVSINNNELIFNLTPCNNAWNLNSNISYSMTFAVEKFLNSGFKYGDIVYVIDYPVGSGLNNFFTYQRDSYNIISYKLTNPSNVYSFTLK